MPGRHPDDDLLADLAADVLPLEQARTVEAHVLSCDRCASLLSDAEHVRNLLLSDDAGPVPAEIWNRIEAALSTAGAPARPQEQPVSPEPPAVRDVDARGSSGWDGPDPLDDPHDWTTSVQPAVREHAPVAPLTGGVRRVTASRRDTRPDRRRRPAPLLLGAAAAVVLLLAVGAVRIAQSGGSGASAAFDASGSSAGVASSSAAGGSAAESAAGAVITRSNADYTSSTLKARARALVQAATTRTLPPRAASSGSETASAVPSARAAARAPAVAADPKATDVTNPARLAACLTALGASSDAVVAVDLARYQGREAAVLVLRTEGGYEVWVVERTCHAGDEGALSETTLAS
jgi:hypothetical protein